MPLPIVSVATEPSSTKTAPTETLTKTVEAGESRYKTHRRFDRAARLFGEPGFHRLMGARVVIFGMGGVGSFAAEALARSGVGHLTLVDFDEVCVTNTNRQLHALRGNIGKQKVEVMAERLRLVSPTATIEPVAKFYQAETSDELLAGNIDYVIDAIDNLTAKTHLLATCLSRGIPVVSSMGAAARLDPTRVRTGDLSETEVCPLARDVRTLLRKNHGLEVVKGKPVGIQAVWSNEQPIAPPGGLLRRRTGLRVRVPQQGQRALHLRPPHPDRRLGVLRHRHLRDGRSQRGGPRAHRLRTRFRWAGVFDRPSSAC
jgi:tRNA A37 threonylcarbamoyladenosine dehydratase